MSVQVLAHDAAATAGLAGLMFKLHRTDATAAMAATVSVDYSSFRNAYGGDWAQRLQVVKLPACAATTPTVPSCRTGTMLPSTNDATTGRVSAQVSASGSDSLFAVAASPSGDAGTYKATALSDAGTWQVATEGGEFSWSYPMTVPSVPGGLEPTVSADYASSSVDGQTATTNNQPSWLGEGWNLEEGFITRGYESCVDANPGTPANQTGDQCWGTDNASLMLNGLSTPLVKVSNDTWHPQDDNGETVQHLTSTTNDNGDNNGEYWVVTTTDGTRYYFGMNHLPGWTGDDTATQSVLTAPVFGSDPENPSTTAFADSAQTQAYRWNLDYVVDPHGDAIAYYYTPETNAYGELLGKKVVSYVRGGTLQRIDYGLRSDSVYSTPAAAQVVFGIADRCVTSGAACDTHNAANWPDVPWDQACAATATSCGTNISPTFWSTKRLSTVTTQVRNGTAYTPVDRWTLTQSYPDPGDTSGDAMWLNSIQRTGLVGGSTSTPAVTFHGITYPNRINTPGDGIVPMDKYRITSIDNESGGVLDVAYDAPDCDPAKFPTPDTNTTRCFPQIWTPPDNANQRTDWFAKYVVGQISEEDTVGGNPDEVTTYEYPKNGGAWHYTDNALVPASRRTWSTWRGYQNVQVIDGDPLDPNSAQSEVDYTYYRGMDGDKLTSGTRSASVTDSQGSVHPDANQLSGQQLEEVTRNGVDGPVVTDEITTPWQNGPTATQGSLSAYMVETGKDVTRTALSAGGWRTTETDTTFNTHDLPTKVSDLGDTGTAADDQCVTTSYATVSTSNLVDLPADVATVGATCGTALSFPADAISDETHTYNSAGDALTTGEVDSYSGTTPHYVTTDTFTYDAYGRVLTSTDPLGNEIRDSYGAPVAGSPAPTSETDATNALGKITTTVDSVAFDQPVKTIDPAGNTTTLTYDALGRLTQVWNPDRPATSSPSQKFGYSVSTSAASWQSTSALDANGNYQTSYTLYDGFMRQRQTQVPAHNNTTSSTAIWRELTDTFYDSQGQVTRENSAYINAAAPSGTLAVSTDPTLIPHATLTEHDGAQRAVVVSELENGNLATDAAGNPWKTITAYGGDHTDVTPPVGTTPTTTYTDARGNTTQLRQYHGSTPTGSFDTTSYTYTRAGQQATITDAAGDSWTYGYDVRGDQTSASDPDKGTSTSTYDVDGNLLSSTDARGQTLAYTYDALNRKTGQYDGSTAGTLLASWAYDPNLGFTSSASTFTGGAEYSQTIDAVDADGRPTKQSVVIPDTQKGLSGTYTTTTTYKPDGSPNTVTTPALGNLPSEALSYTYDYLGAAVSMSGLAFYVTNTLYGQDNQVEQLQFGPDTKAAWETLTRDIPTDRLTTIGVQTLHSDGNVDTQRYGYDLSGTITSETDQMPGQATDNQCFGYDYLQRLTQAWTTTATACGTPGAALGGPAAYWQTYSYNLLGDRTQQVQHATTAGGTDTTTDYGYATAGHAHALSSVTTTSPAGTKTAGYAYNATGDTTGRPGPDGGAQTLTWNQNDQTSQVTEGTSTASYLYAADGSRLIAHDASGTTLYLPSGEVHVGTGGNGATGTRYYTYDNLTVARRVGATVTYLVSDSQGTTNLEIDSGTLAVTKRRFDPFGNPRGGTAFPGDRGFIGGTRDTTTGLTHLGARDYDPSLGRFTSVDPILVPSEPADFDPYVYSQDNPATMSDPSGQLPGMSGCISNGNGDCVPEKDLPPQLTHPKPPAKPTGGSGSSGGYGNLICSILPKYCGYSTDRCGGLYPCGSPYAPPKVQRPPVPIKSYDNSHIPSPKPRPAPSLISRLGGGISSLLSSGWNHVKKGFKNYSDWIGNHPAIMTGLGLGLAVLSTAFSFGLAAPAILALDTELVAGEVTAAGVAVDVASFGDDCTQGCTGNDVAALATDAAGFGYAPAFVRAMGAGGAALLVPKLTEWASRVGERISATLGLGTTVGLSFYPSPSDPKGH
ncbi:RHS repeat-associated core domain-containing protein [Rugosimonospora acidiphila]|uniref:RHS repeat-associated core domain-containing protein n=2 Tax=Rugosimonospora acidiphila TaxID=556531 RepID=A0ABP9RV85_9ACTN